MSSAVALVAVEVARSTAVPTIRLSVGTVVACAALLLLEWPSGRLLEAVGEPDPWVFLGPLLIWLLGVPAALVLGVGTMLLTSLLLRKGPMRWVFNVCLRALVVLGSTWTLRAVTGQEAPFEPELIAHPRGLLALILAQIAWWAIGWVCVSVIVALAESKPLWRELAQDSVIDFTSGFLFGVAGPAVLLALAFQPWLLPFLVLPQVGALASAQRAVRQRTQARTDALTQLPNRVAIYEESREAIANAIRREGTAAIALVDLNGFKPVNDRFGHEVGDEVLRVMGQRLRWLAGEERCLTGRLGGDEFVILWRGDASAEDYRARAEAVRQLLREPMELAVGALRLDASIGVAICPDDGDELPDLLRRADHAMYRAKGQGGGVVLAAHLPAPEGSPMAQPVAAGS